jgi:hypothetical protein
MNHETTLCTAIEAGYLEQQVLLLAESLRLFGGRRANMPLVAVRPRTGPRIASSTRKRLEKLEVILVEDETLSVTHAWWAMANKAAALSHVEDKARTANITWIDGDMMVLSAPGSFAPPQGYDFIARAGEAHDVASNGRDEKDEYWRRLCSQLKLDFDAFPEIISYPDEKPIKAYWQGGLFTYRRNVRFSCKFREIYEAILDGEIASKHAGTYHTDQVSLALAVQAQGLRVAQYDPRMNFNVSPLDKVGSAKLAIADVQIMQYHSSLWPAEYAWTRPFLAELPADRMKLLDQYAPFGKPRLVTRLLRKLYQLPRNPKLKAYEARTVRY